MTKKFLIILALVILLIPIIGCQNQHSNQKEAVTGNKFVPPPFTKITVYVDGNKIDLKKDDSKFKTLSDEIYKGIVNITDGVGGQRTFWEVGFEKEKEPDHFKKNVYIFAEWDKRHKISLNQKENTQGGDWGNTPRDKEGNYVLNTDGFLVTIYKPNLDSRFAYKAWSDGVGAPLRKPERPVYWAYAKTDSIDYEKLLNIVDPAT